MLTVGPAVQHLVALLLLQILPTTSSVRPGDDFFTFANAEWLQRTAIPAGADLWNARSELDTLSRRQVGALLDEARSAPVGSTARKDADFRAALLDGRSHRIPVGRRSLERPVLELPALSRSRGERHTDAVRGFARSWRGKSTDVALRADLASNHHAPERYRVWTVRNLDAWYAAFDVKNGDVFYLEPRSRVRVW